MSLVAKINTQINLIEKILKKLEMLEERIENPNLSHDIAVLRNLSYLELWQYCVKNLYYHFQLKDSSLLIFHYKNNDDFSYSFISCPFKCLTYKEWLAGQEFDYHEIGDSFHEEYSQYLEHCNLIESPVVFRYDYQPSSYNEGLHPASHLHIGFKNNSRLGFNKLLEPLAFIFFVFRQHYTNNYDYILKNNLFIDILENYKDKLEDIEKEHYNNKDNWEYYLN